MDLLKLEKVDLNSFNAYTELELIIKFIKKYNENVDRMNYNLSLLKVGVNNANNG